MEIILTGVKSTGTAHIGNYLGAIRPAIQRQNRGESKGLFFIADYHSMTAPPKPEDLKQSVLEVAAAWLASGLDLNNAILYRQSDIPEVFELNWILSCFTPKGFMNRAHAYKARVDANQEAGNKDLDHGVNMGLYNYPVLMAADILLFSPDKVPVGPDQVQHIEFARDMAQKFNNTYGEYLKLPDAITQKEVLIPGLDGRKMSKSYGNTIELFLDSKKLRKKVMKVKTDSQPPESPKNPDDSLVFDLFKFFSSADEQKELADWYRRGIGWGEAKQVLFERMQAYFNEKKAIYDDLMAHPEKLNKILDEGAEAARAISRPKLKELRDAMGIGR